MGNLSQAGINYLQALHGCTNKMKEFERVLTEFDRVFGSFW
jgi:hypothetical protein